MGPDQCWPSPSRRALSSKQLAGAWWPHSQSLVSAAGSCTGWQSAPAPGYLGPPRACGCKQPLAVTMAGSIRGTVLESSGMHRGRSGSHAGPEVQCPVLRCHVPRGQGEQHAGLQPAQHCLRKQLGQSGGMFSWRFHGCEQWAGLTALCLQPGSGLQGAGVHQVSTLWGWGLLGPPKHPAGSVGPTPRCRLPPPPAPLQPAVLCPPLSPPSRSTLHPFPPWAGIPVGWAALGRCH